MKGPGGPSPGPTTNHSGVLILAKELTFMQIEKFRVFYSHVLDMEEALKICAEVLMKYEL